MALFDFMKKKFKDKHSKQLRDLEKYELPSFPSTVLNLLAKLRDPDSTVQELADEIEIDPGLHVRILKTVNSVAFGLSRKVDTVRHAVTLLGRSRIEALVLSVAVKDTVGKAPTTINTTRFWRTAALRAALSRRLAGRLNPGKEAEAFAAGLLQDMGVPVLAGALSGYGEVYKNWLETDDADLIALEREHFQTDHAKVGSLVAEKWSLPPYLAKAIAHHHNPENSPHIITAVQIAALLKDTSETEKADTLAQNANEQFGVDPTDFVSALESAQEDSKELVSALS